jgi:hypothetical protein
MPYFSRPWCLTERFPEGGFYGGFSSHITSFHITQTVEKENEKYLEILAFKKQRTFDPKKNRFSLGHFSFKILIFIQILVNITD